MRTADNTASNDFVAEQPQCRLLLGPTFQVLPAEYYATLCSLGK